MKRRFPSVLAVLLSSYVVPAPRLWQFYSTGDLGWID